MAFFSDSFGRLRMLSLSKHVARYNKDGLLRGHQMSGARPIKTPYTRDQVTFTGFFDSTLWFMVAARTMASLPGIASRRFNSIKWWIFAGF
jgi:cbb3-type cytochrome oxidase subunit 1